MVTLRGEAALEPVKNSPRSLAVLAAPGQLGRPRATQVVFSTLSWLCQTDDWNPRFTRGPTTTVKMRPPHPVEDVALHRLSVTRSPSSKVIIMIPSPPV